MTLSRTLRQLLPPLFMLLLTLTGPRSGMAGGQEDKPVLVVTDPEINDLITEISKPLLIAADLDPETVRFHIILNASLNAFALPNQHIVLHSGLVLAAGSLDEIAGVMAHEVGHLTAGHHLKLKSTARNASIKALVISAMGLAAGVASGNHQLSQAAIIGGQAGAVSEILDDMREKETQSDRLAVGYLQKAGYHPAELATFLDRISQTQRLTDLPPPYLLTHPVSSQRVMEVASLAAETPPLRPHPDLSEERLLRVRAKLEAGTGIDPMRATETFRARLGTVGPENLQGTPGSRFANRYGLALALRYAGRLPEALEELAILMKDRPPDPYLLRERGLIQMERDHLAQAIEDLEAASRLKPDSFDLAYHLAFAQSESGDLTGAASRLRRVIVDHPLEAEAYYLLGVVEGKRGLMGASHLALARHHRLNLDRETALWHYREAVRQFAKGEAGEESARDEMERLEKEAVEEERANKRRRLRH
ncbi:MAG: M48 family metalloprotease [Magnetococcales bacterium]|nr:M48 family metalloprotease [Magnetococcales bacterium]